MREVINSRRILFLFLFITPLFLVSCSTPREHIDNWLYKEYAKYGRLDKYYEIKKDCDKRIVLFLNRKEDRNFLINWFFCYIVPDIPDILAAGSVLGVFYLIAWLIGATLTGGGILAVLAFIGSLFGVIPGIPPAIMGIIYLGLLFSIFTQLWRLLIGG